jgi:hypothetical protein
LPENLQFKRGGKGKKILKVESAPAEEIFIIAEPDITQDKKEIFDDTELKLAIIDAIEGSEKGITKQALKSLIDKQEEVRKGLTKG